MKLYFPKSHYRPKRRFVFPLLRPFTKGEGYTDAERKTLYGISEKDFEFTDNLENADLAILTMAWNYYVNSKQTDLAIAFIKDCQVLGKKVITVNLGDSGVRIPYFENLIVLRASGYKSKFSPNEYAFPPMIEDPLATFFKRKTIFERPYTPEAVIGFCGQANSSRINALKEILNTSFQNIKFYAGFSLKEPQQLFSTSLLRATVLKAIQKSSEVDTNFILRRKYRAGVTVNKGTHKTTMEFYTNIKDSDYVVCVRGAGNFSIRFYEALAMGRIPVFINTDCALPFADKLDWKKHVVWIEYKDRYKAAETVALFHSSLSEKEFIDLQLANRKLWEDKLTLGGFFKNFIFTFN